MNGAAVLTTTTTLERGGIGSDGAFKPATIEALEVDDRQGAGVPQC